MSELKSNSVVINDWSVLDSPVSNAPYVIISISQDFTAVQDTMSPVTTWNINVLVVVPFVDWTTSLKSIGDIRQAMIDAMNEIGTNRSAGGYDDVNIVTIRNLTGVVPDYPPYTKDEDVGNVLPLNLTQPLNFETKVVE